MGFSVVFSLKKNSTSKCAFPKDLLIFQSLIRLIRYYTVWVRAEKKPVKVGLFKLGNVRRASKKTANKFHVLIIFYKFSHVSQKLSAFGHLKSYILKIWDNFPKIQKHGFLLYLAPIFFLLKIIKLRYSIFNY